MSEAPTPTTEAAPAPAPVVDPAPAPAPAPVPETKTESPALPGDGSLLAEAAPEEKLEPTPEGADTASAPDYSTLKVPEGLTIDDTLMGSFQEVAKTNGLSVEASQSLLDLYGQTVQSQVDAAAKQLAEQAQTTWKDVNAAWLKELEAVPDFQGDTKKASLQTITKALEEFGVGDVRRAFALTGAGNNPAIVQTFLKMARALSEGTAITAGAPTTGPKTAGEILYPPSAS